MQVPKRLSNAVQALLAPYSIGDSALSKADAASQGASALAAGSNDVNQSCASAGGVRVDTEEQELQGHVLAALGKISLQDSSLASKVSQSPSSCPKNCPSPSPLPSSPPSPPSTPSPSPTFWLRIWDYTCKQQCK